MMKLLGGTCRNTGLRKALTARSDVLRPSCFSTAVKVEEQAEDVRIRHCITHEHNPCAGLAKYMF